MKCEVRNVQSSETFSIPAEGHTFGRQGGPANITIADQSVSKRHARIYMEGGKWFLEDLKSVNGTVVNNRRITEPMPLAPGFTFSLSKHQFQIVSVEADRSAPAGRPTKQNGAAAEAPSDPRRAEPRPAARPAGASPPAGSARSRPQPPPSQPVDVPDIEPMLPPSDPSSHSMHQGGGYDDEPGAALGDAEAASAGEAIKKAFGYYLAAVPLMVLNPIGTVKKGVEDPKLPFMTGVPLGLFLVPVYAGAVGLQNAAVGLSGVIAGGGSIPGAVIGAGIGAAVGVVVSIVMGFIAHPLTVFFVERLFKGETDEKTRTNAVIMGATATAIVMLVGAASVLFGGIVARVSASFKYAAFLQMLPVLAAVIANVLPGYIGWQWLKAWNTAKWAQTLAIVLMILGGVLGVVGVVSTGRTAWAVVSAGGGGGAVGTTPEEIERLKKEAEEKIKALEGGGKEDPKEGKDPKEDPKEVKKDDPKEDPKEVKKDDPKEDPKEVKKDDPKEDPKEIKKDDPPPKGVGAAIESGPARDVAEKRDAILKRLAADPTFILNGAALDKYKAYAKCAHAQRDAARDRLGEGKRRDIPNEYLGASANVYGDLINALVLKSCAKQIDDLHGAMR